MLSSSAPTVERARPLLGTRVSIKLAGLAEAQANRLIDKGFDAVATVHALMSFHEAGSDVSALNREAARKSVAVAPETYEVIRCGLDIAAASKGVFDFTVARDLVQWGFLPRPEDAPDPDVQASWRDIELLDNGRIRFHRPLWIDLGGIAKGYAVDRAVATVTGDTDVQCCVNAGGDLRVKGKAPERVMLRTGLPVTLPSDTVPVVEIENGSLASSGGREHLKRYNGRLVGPHLHGARRDPAGTRSFVSVVAEDCIIADALTKVVLARGLDAETLLIARGATAYLHNTRSGWRVIGRESE
jgi:thiamine biosynthesis lipoprotein